MNTHIQLRNKDFVRRCIEVFEGDYAAGAIRPLDTVIERALACRPRCHYLDYDTASYRLHRIRRYGLEAEVSSPLARQMWAELDSQVSETMNCRGQLSFSRALTFVLMFKRPSRFYMTHDTARRLLSPHISYSLNLNQSARL